MCLIWLWLVVTLAQLVNITVTCHEDYQRTKGYESAGEEIRHRHEIWKKDRHAICHREKAYERVNQVRFFENAERYYVLLEEAKEVA